MSALLPAVVLLAHLVAPAAPEPDTGFASRYAPRVMAEVVAHRNAKGWWRNPLPHDWYTVAGYAATTDCGAVGRVIHMRPAGATRWERVLIADCAGDHATLDWMLTNSIIAELDYDLFMRWAETHGLPLAIEVQP